MTETSWITTYSPLIIAVGIFLGFVVSAIGIVAAIWQSNRSSSNQTSRDIGALQSDVRHLEKTVEVGFQGLLTEIQAGNADILSQLKGHGHVDGNTVFYAP